MNIIGKLTKKILNCNHAWQEYHWYNVELQRPKFTISVYAKRCRKCGVIDRLLAEHNLVNGRYVPNSLMVGRLRNTPQRVSRGGAGDVSPSLTSAPMVVTTYTTNPNESKYW